MAKTFRELNVYMRAVEASREVFELTQHWPPVERYSLSNQIRRSSRAVAALIAEAWARRVYNAAFINCINQAIGEVYETKAWFDHALACEYIDDARHESLLKKWDEIGGMLQRMIHRASSFAPSNGDAAKSASLPPDY